MKAKLAKFTGEGTVLRSNIIGGVEMVQRLRPEDGIARLRVYIDQVVHIIERHSGTILRFEGDDVLAFWQSSDHAQRAFDASCAILHALSTSKNALPAQIVLGTGEMGGDFIGIGKQYQIVGKAMAITDRLSKVGSGQDPVIRMSQFTAQAIKASMPLQEEGEIAREGLDALRVYAYRPANKG